jgi:hypothetical protein
MSFCWRCGEIQFETWIALKLNQSTFSEVIFNKKNTFWCVWTGNASISKKYVCCPITVIHLFVFIIKLQIIYFYYLYFKIGLSAHYSYLTKMIFKISNSQLMTSIIDNISFIYYFTAIQNKDIFEQTHLV